jgi:protein gp37
VTTKIEWTEQTWNPVTGCTPISPGCFNCYAERMARRLAGRNGYPPAPDHFKVTLHPERLRIWKDFPKHKLPEPRKIFVCSMSDLFHPDVPDYFIDQVWNVMDTCQIHTFQLLTKRPERMQKYVQSRFDRWSLVLPNVWLGVTCEDQQRADERIPLLLQTPAAVRFVSCEPLLGPVDLRYWALPVENCPICHGMGHPWIEAAELSGYDFRATCDCRKIYLDWVIAGGETGPGARPMQREWADSLYSQCEAAGVPLFFKKPGTASGWTWPDAPREYPEEAQGA